MQSSFSFLFQSQSQTMDKLGIILRSPVWTHGQLYVALSRVRSRADICIRVEQIPSGPTRQGRDLAGLPKGIYTHNVVFQQVLQDILRLRAQLEDESRSDMELIAAGEAYNTG
jgi:hypothetical protein